jgi:hypothetical protein
MASSLASKQVSEPRLGWLPTCRKTGRQFTVGRPSQNAPLTVLSWVKRSPSPPERNLGARSPKAPSYEHPEAIEVGKCYPTEGKIVRRVVGILPDGRAQYERYGGRRARWKAGILTGREFARHGERKITCDRAPQNGR